MATIWRGPTTGRDIAKAFVLSLVVILALVLAGPITLAQPGDDVKEPIETALRADLSTVRRILDLSNQIAASGQPQTEEEISEWVQNAQMIRAEMIDLTNKGNTARVALLDSLKAGALGGGPLVEPAVSYFEAENEFFRLTEKAQESTTVMVFNPRAASPEDMRKLRALSELGAAVLKSYDALLASQQNLVTKAHSQGIDLLPVWDPAQQEPMLEPYRAMSKMAL